MKYYLGIDLGGTNTKIGILDEMAPSSRKARSPRTFRRGRKPRASASQGEWMKF